MDIGRAIKTCREFRKLSQIELAKKVKISRSYLCLIESNQREPNLAVLEKIAKGLRISLPILVFLASDKKETELSDDLFERITKHLGDLMNEES